MIQGDPEPGKEYTEAEFNRIIEIKQREEVRVKEYLRQADQKQKAIVFCATQAHAAVTRDLINQHNDGSNPMYCCRVTANDGGLGEEKLKQFQDNEKTIPTVLTTSRKLSTGVDAPQVRNIVLMRPCKNMIEFKQIIGRGTRLYDGKDYFTIYDFVDAYQNFLDPEWDGEPLEPVPLQPGGIREPGEGFEIVDSPPSPPRPQKIKIKLADGKVRLIQCMTAVSYWSPDGTPISAQEFLEKLFGRLPEFYSSETELRQIWSKPATPRELLARLDEAGFGSEALGTLQEMIAASDSDILDVFAYVSCQVDPRTRASRVAPAQDQIYQGIDHFVIVSRRERDSQPRCSVGDRGWADRGNVETGF